MNAGNVAAGAAAVLVGAMGFAAAGASDLVSSTETVTVAVVADTIGTEQYQGICAVVTPPDPDPCDAVNGTLRYGALGALERSAYHPKWVAANPGEVARLSVIMAAPVCSVPSTPQPPLMLTQYGAGLAELMRAVACARHPEPIVWPPLPPAPNPNRTDKTPPTAPGPLNVVPGG